MIPNICIFPHSHDIPPNSNRCTAKVMRRVGGKLLLPEDTISETDYLGECMEWVPVGQQCPNFNLHLPNTNVSLV